MHLLAPVQIDELREFLRPKISTVLRGLKPNISTLRSFSTSSTSATSHQLSNRHNDPTRLGRLIRYDLNNTVSTICAYRRSCSGVSAGSGRFGKANSSEAEVSDRVDSSDALAGVMLKVANAPDSLGLRSPKYTRRFSIDLEKSSAQ